MRAAFKNLHDRDEHHFDFELSGFGYSKVVSYSITDRCSTILKVIRLKKVFVCGEREDFITSRADFQSNYLCVGLGGITAHKQSRRMTSFKEWL